MATHAIAKTPHATTEFRGNMCDNDALIARRLCERATVGVFWNDADGNCAFVNGRICQFFDAPLEALLGDRWIKFIHPDDRLRVFHDWKAAVDAHKAFSAEYRIQRSDSELTWVHAEAHPDFTDAGEFQGYVGTLVDVTKRKLAEQHLELRLRFEELISRLSADFVAVEPVHLDQLIASSMKAILDFTGTDRVGVFQFSEDRSSARLCYEQCRDNVDHGLDPSRFEKWRALNLMDMQWLWTELIVGRDVVISSLADMPAHAAVDRQILEDQQTRSTLTVLMRVAGKNIGVLYLDAVLSEHVWTDSFVTQMRLIARIIGTAMQRRQAAQQMAEQEEMLAHAARLSTMGEMLAEISHELNQPLFAIGNYADALGVRLADSDSLQSEATLLHMRKWLGGLADAQKHASNIVVGMRGFSDRREASRMPHSINEVVRQSVELTTFHARRRSCVVTMRLEEELPHVVVHAQGIQQVIMNLLTNAFEAMDAVDLADRIAVVGTSSSDDGQHVLIQVSDNGPGFSCNTNSFEFQPFKTTKTDGLGLGLSISRRIVLMHGGEITFHNGERGAEVRVRLPVNASAKKSG